MPEQTFYHWKKKYGGMGTEQFKELKRLQKENERLRRAASFRRVAALLRDAGWELNDKRVEIVDSEA